jgi:hypothetical protein
MTFGNQFFGVFFINIEPLRLHIRTEISSGVRTFVVVEAAPFERIYQIFDGSFHIPVPVGVFDAQNEFAVVFASK